MDIDKLIEAVRLCGSSPTIYQCEACAYYTGGDMGACIPEMTAQAIGTTPDRLRELAQADREKNDPLTLDELRGMRGKWVWVVSPDKDLTVSAWAYVGANHVFTYWEYDNDELVGRVVYNLCDYGAWIAYRNPIKTVMPGEEQHGV